MTTPQIDQAVTRAIADAVNYLETIGAQPIAIVAAVLCADGNAHISGMSNDRYPSALEFQRELSELFDVVYGDRKAAVEKLTGEAVETVAAALEQSRAAWLTGDDAGTVDVDYQTLARIACTTPRRKPA